jgi:hypothetical protein
LSSVCLLTKEPSSLRVCSRSNIAGDDLTFEIKSVIGVTPAHSLCAVRTHLIQHGRYQQDSTCGVVHHELHNGASWLGQQLVILCIPLVPWLNDF